MRTFLLKNSVILVAVVVFGQQAAAQKKLLILGSSTSTCIFGPSTYDSCYVTRLQKYYQSIGSPIIVDNRAVGGDNVYYGMPVTNIPPPPGRSNPKPYNNITDGLMNNPDVVLINYPSNGYETFSVDEVMVCLRTIKQTANNAGKPCYITTSQPRHDPEIYKTEAVRNKMFEIRSRILSEFGTFAINFWDGIANPNDYSIQPAYNADGTHLNDAGHRILFTRVLERNIFSQQQDNTPPTVPANLSVTSTGTNYVNLAWDNSSDNVGVSRYHIFENGAAKYTTTANSFAASNLNSNSTYYYSVTAEDNAGNNSSASNQVSGTTLGASSGSGLTYKYYEGDWNTLPDFHSLQPVKSGSASNIELAARNRNDYYGFLWEGRINIQNPGTYTFELVSDDGSKLYFNSSYNPKATALVDNDGLHGGISAYGSVNINAAGSYPVAISFFDKVGSEQMQLFWSGPGFSRQLVPNEAFSGAPTGSPTGSGGSGLTYKYYEGDWNTLPDFRALQPVKSGSSENVDLGPRNRSDNFAFLWEGYINIPTAGNYTFETISDDGSKLYFNSFYDTNSSALVNNDGLHTGISASGSVNVTAAGSYPIAISFFENTGTEQMQVYWSGPGIPRQLIPNAAFSASAQPGGNGLKYKYYEGDWNLLPDFSSLQPVKSGALANVDLSPRNRNSYYAFLWEGYIKIQNPGTYTFETVSDDGSRLYFNTFYNVNTTALVNNDGIHVALSAYGSVNISAPGSYPIAISSFEKYGSAQMQVYWSGPGFSRQRIPNEAFTQSPSFVNTILERTSNIQSASITEALNTDKMITAYPNPFREKLDINFYNKVGNNNISTGIFDLSGKRIYNQEFKNLPSGSSNLRINLKERKDLPAGVYFLKVDVNGIPFKVLKLIKSK